MMPFTTPSTAPVAQSKTSRRRLTRNSTGYDNGASSADGCLPSWLWCGCHGRLWSVAGVGAEGRVGSACSPSVVDDCVVSFWAELEPAAGDLRGVHPHIAKLLRRSPR